MTTMYKNTVYKIDELTNLIDSYENTNENTNRFFQEFNEDKIRNLAEQRKNTQSLFFVEANKDGGTRTKIIQLLNRCNSSNMETIFKELKKITFTTNEELMILIKECLKKIKEVSEIMKPYFGNLCKDLLSFFFKGKDNKNIYLKPLMLESIFKEYSEAMNFTSEKWNKDNAKKVMILLGTLINSKVIEHEITVNVVNDFTNRIEHKKDGKSFHVDDSIELLSLLVSVVSDEESRSEFLKIKDFLEEQLFKYEKDKENGIKGINIRSKFFLKNTIESLN